MLVQRAAHGDGLLARLDVRMCRSVVEHYMM